MCGEKTTTAGLKNPFFRDSYTLFRVEAGIQRVAGWAAPSSRPKVGVSRSILSNKIMTIVPPATSIGLRCRIVDLWPEGSRVSRSRSSRQKQNGNQVQAKSSIPSRQSAAASAMVSSSRVKVCSNDSNRLPIPPTAKCSRGPWPSLIGKSLRLDKPRNRRRSTMCDLTACGKRAGVSSQTTFRFGP